MVKISEFVHNKISNQNKLLLNQRLFSLRMNEGTPLRDHLDQLNTILLKLSNIDVKVKDEDSACFFIIVI